MITYLQQMIQVQRKESDGKHAGVLRNVKIA